MKCPKCSCTKCEKGKPCPECGMVCESLAAKFLAVCEDGLASTNLLRCPRCKSSNIVREDDGESMRCKDCGNDWIANKPNGAFSYAEGYEGLPNKMVCPSCKGANINKYADGSQECRSCGQRYNGVED